MPTGRRVLRLLPGDVELDAVLADCGHGAEWVRHYLAAGHVSLLEEQVGDLVAARVKDKPLDSPDRAVGGMDVLTDAHGHLPEGRVS